MWLKKIQQAYAGNFWKQLKERQLYRNKSKSGCQLAAIESKLFRLVPLRPLKESGECLLHNQHERQQQQKNTKAPKSLKKNIIKQPKLTNQASNALRNKNKNKHRQRKGQLRQGKKEPEEIDIEFEEQLNQEGNQSQIMEEKQNNISISPKQIVVSESKSNGNEERNQRMNHKKCAEKESFFSFPLDNDNGNNTQDQSQQQQQIIVSPQLRKELIDQTNLNGPTTCQNSYDSTSSKGSFSLKLVMQNNPQDKLGHIQNENVLPAPAKKKREFNLPLLMVEEISKVDKEIPITDGGSQKKKKNIFTFYDNFHEYTVFCDVAMKKGSRDIQEDRFSAESPIDAKFKRDSFFAVYDGHGTTVVADTLKEHLHKYISKNEHYPTDVHQSIKESFQKIDEEILLKQKEEILSSGGSTALCCLIRGDQLYIINCGDSSSVMVSNEYTVEMLNNLHKPSQKEEAERLTKQKTLYTSQRVMDTLAVTRALGDYKHKEYIISEPEISVYTINEQSKYCLLGTDGFWDVVNYQLDLPSLLQNRDAQKGESERKSLKDLSTFLIEHASNKPTRQKKDNMTLLAIDLNWFYRQNLEFKDANTGEDNDLQMEDDSSNCVMCSSKSQLNIDTQFSSFIFQAKSPHSVGRNIDKKLSLSTIVHPQINSASSLNYPKTCSKPASKRAFFDEEQPEENNYNFVDNVISPDLMKVKTIDDIPEYSKQSNEDDEDKQQSPPQAANKKPTGGFFQF